MLIEDGTGSGKTAKVNDQNRLDTNAVATTIEHHINHHDGLSFILIIEQTPSYSDPSDTTGEVCFCYIKNTSTIDLILEEMDIRLAGTAQSEIITIRGISIGTPVGGDTLTPVNLNLGSGNIADGTFLGGSEITGLSGGSIVSKTYIASSNQSDTFNFGQDIIVPKNNIITFWATNLDTEIDISLLFNYHSLG